MDADYGWGLERLSIDDCVRLRAVTDVCKGQGGNGLREITKRGEFSFLVHGVDEGARLLEDVLMKRRVHDVRRYMRENQDRTSWATLELKKGAGKRPMTVPKYEKE